MRYRCQCGKITAIINQKWHRRKSAEIVCAKCMKRFIDAVKLVEKAKELVNCASTPYDEEASDNATLEFLKRMFYGKVGP